MVRRRLLACVMTTGLLGALVSGQQPGEIQAEQEVQVRPPVFRTGTNLVRVDVSVLGRDGQPVRSLTADDFELRENGEVQAITSFKLVNATGEPTDDLSLPIRSQAHAATEAARDDVRLFLIFWDEYHIDQFGSAVRAREQLERFVLESFGPTDLIALMDPLTPISALRFSRDRRALANRIHQLRGRRGVYVPARSAIEEAHLRNAQDVERIRSQVTTSALKSALVHLGSLRQGRKAVIFVSEGLGRLGQDTLRVVSDLVRTANDSNTAIYTADPRGLQAGPGIGSGMSSLLAALSDSTGAEPIVSNDMTGSLRKVVAAASSFYLLGYSPKNNQLDGKFREIQVKVKQSGVEVRARNGYWAPRGSDVARARALAAAAAMPSPINEAFGQLTPDNSRRAAEFWIGHAPVSESEVDVRVAWTPRPEIVGRGAAAAVSMTVTTGEQILFDGPVEESGAIFRAPPGELQLDLNIHDEAGEIIDREQRDVEVPDPAAADLALATPVLSRARTPAELRTLMENADEPAPFAGREFSRLDRVLLRVVPYGIGAANAHVSAQLVGRRGNTLARLPIKRRDNGPGYQLELPLTSMANGEFVVAIAARTALGSVETYVPIRIGR